MIMQRYKLILIAMLISLIFVSCTKPKEPSVKVTNLMDQVTDKIVKDYKTTSREQLGYNRLDFLKDDSKDIVSTMKLEKNTIEEGIYLSDPTGKTSDRIMIVKAKKDTDIKGVVDAFRKMQEKQDKEWKKKQKKQYEKVKNGIIDTNGKYVIYIVYDDMASLMKIINDKIAKSKNS